MAPPRKTQQKKKQQKRQQKKMYRPAKVAKAADSSLKQIPANVQKFLKDLQVQIQSGAVDLADWRSLGVGIMSRLGQVTERVRSAKNVKKTTRKKV